MSAADKAYARAVRRIEEVARTRELELDLSNLGALETLPDAIADLTWLKTLRVRGFRSPKRISDISSLQNLTALKRLYLANTQVRDITPLRDLTALLLVDLDGTKVTDVSPLQNLTALNMVNLGNTQVNNIAPLQNLIALEMVVLHHTQVADIKPLQNLRFLESLILNNTPVCDLRPIASIPFSEPGIPRTFGLRFKNTPATQNAPELKALSEIEDDTERTQKNPSLPAHPAALP